MTKVSIDSFTLCYVDMCTPIGNEKVVLGCGEINSFQFNIIELYEN